MAAQYLRLQGSRFQVKMNQATPTQAKAIPESQIRASIQRWGSRHDCKAYPTQKPVQLLRYLVADYTKEGDTVFDPFVGSGTTAIACQQLKRHFIAIEKNVAYAAKKTAISRQANRTARRIRRLCGVRLSGLP